MPPSHALRYLEPWMKQKELRREKGKVEAKNFLELNNMKLYSAAEIKKQKDYCYCYIYFLERLETDEGKSIYLNGEGDPLLTPLPNNTHERANEEAPQNWPLAKEKVTSFLVLNCQVCP